MSTASRNPPVAVPASPRIDEVIPEGSQEQVERVNSSIPLAEGENILWHRSSTRGLLHKEVTMEEAVTNRRCLKCDVEKHEIVAQIGISHRPDALVMNVHRVNDSVGGGVFSTPRMFGLPGLGGFGVYGGPRRGNIKIFGDGSIMSEGKVVMTFENIASPQGLRFLIETLKREQSFRGPGLPGQLYRQRFRPQ
jgi:hypothetical protein